MSTNWWLDIEEDWLLGSDTEVTKNYFSVGPFAYNTSGCSGYGCIDVETLMSAINSKLVIAGTGATCVPSGEGVYDPFSSSPNWGSSMLIYHIEPHLVKLGPFEGFGRNGVWAAPGGAGFTLPQDVIDAINNVSSDHSADSGIVIRYRIWPTLGNNSVVPTCGTLTNFTVKSRQGAHGSSTPAALPGAGSSWVDPPWAEMEVYNHTDSIMVSSLHSSTSAIILDHPPVPPDMRIVPYQGISDKVLLLLNSNVGEYMARPIIIQETDTTFIAAHLLNQYNIVVDPSSVPALLDFYPPMGSRVAVKYKTDDPIFKYEVYRTTTKPLSYADFPSSPYKIVTSQLSLGKRASSASLIDNISSNTKYYYCARAVDIHNNFSNPTHIFEVELVDNEGQTYLILEPLFLGNAVHTGGRPAGEDDTPYENDTSIKSGRRFMLVQPSAGMVALDSEALITLQALNPSPLQVPDPDILGPVAFTPGAEMLTKVWNNMYKLRVTSRKTNRQFDLNITFKNTGVDNV